MVKDHHIALVAHDPPRCGHSACIMPHGNEEELSLGWLVTTTTNLYLSLNLIFRAVCFNFCLSICLRWSVEIIGLSLG